MVGLQGTSTMDDRAAVKKILAVFDYDGTLTPKGATEASPHAVAGIRKLWKSGVMTTVVTARPYQRLRAIAGGLEAIVSRDIPLATERGARIVGGRRETNLEYYPLGSRELTAVAGMDKEDVEFIGFYPEQLGGTSFIWTPDPGKIEDMNVQFGHDAIILPCDIAALQGALERANPCLATIRFTKQPDDEIASNLLPADLNTAWSNQSVSVIAKGINKLSALAVLCEVTRTNFCDTMYAGDNANDLPVLSISDLRERIFVGQQPLSGIAEPFTHLASHEELGGHLVKISEGLHAI